MNASPLVNVIDRRRDHHIPHTRHYDECVDDGRVGPIDRLGIDKVLARVASLPAWTEDHGIRRTAHIDGARMVLDWLQSRPEDGWQQRWIASGADGGTRWIEDLVRTDLSALSNVVKRDRLLRGVTALLLCRAVLPGYRFLHSYKPRTLYDRCRQVFRRTCSPRSTPKPNRWRSHASSEPRPAGDHEDGHPHRPRCSRTDRSRHPGAAVLVPARAPRNRCRSRAGLGAVARHRQPAGGDHGRSRPARATIDYRTSESVPAARQQRAQGPGALPR